MTDALKEYLKLTAPIVGSSSKIVGKQFRQKKQAESKGTLIGSRFRPLSPNRSSKATPMGLKKGIFSSKARPYA